MTQCGAPRARQVDACTLASLDVYGKRPPIAAGLAVTPGNEEPVPHEMRQRLLTTLLGAGVLLGGGIATCLALLNDGVMLATDWLRSGLSLLAGLAVVYTAQRSHSVESRYAASEKQYQDLSTRVDDVVAERTRVLEALLEGSKDLAATLDLDALLARILDRLSSLVDYEGTGIILRDGDEFIVRANRVPFDSQPLTSLRLSPDHPILQQILNSRQPLVVQDLLVDPALQTQVLSIPGPTAMTGFIYIRSWMGVPLVADGQVIGLLFVDHHLPDWFTPERQYLVEVFADQMALALKNARLHRDTQARLAEMSSLQRVTRALLETHSLEGILDIVCSEACALIDAAAGAVFVLDAGELTVAHQQGPFEFGVPSLQDLVLRVCERGTSCFCNHPADLVPLVPGLPEWLASILMIPLRLNESSMGALCVANKATGFSEDDRRILSLLADNTAMALNGARLTFQMQQLAVVQERQRLAMQLHDSVSQALYSSMLFADTVDLALKAGKSDEASANLMGLQGTLDEAMKAMRMLVFELRPPALDEGLFPALELRLSAVERRVGLKTELLVQNEQRLPADIESEVYWIAVEALNNVVKHACATSVTVSLRFHQDDFCMEIADDGAGFDPVIAQRGAGLGLVGMRERAASIGATLAITSWPGPGTKVQLRIVWHEKGRG